MHAATRGRRLVSAALLTLSLGITGTVAGPAAPVTAGPSACEGGWGAVRTMDMGNLQDIRMLAPDLAIAVGTGDGEGPRREAAWAWWDGTGWTEGRSGSKMIEGLMALAGGRATPLWAVGFAQGNQASLATARRWVAGGWQADDPPKHAGGTVLVGADLDPTGGLWAVGMAANGAGVRTGLIWRHTATDGWKVLRAGPARSSFAAVAAVAPDDVWVVGSRWGKAGVRPLMRHWNGTAWSEEPLPDLGVDAALVSIAGDPVDGLWAVGWRTLEGVLRPLVLQRQGGTWAVAAAPDLGGSLGVLLDVSIDPDGRPWVGGAVYRTATDGYLGMVARRGDDGWTVWPDAPTPSRWVSAVAGDPANVAWVAAAGTGEALLQRVCEPPPRIAGHRRIRHRPLPGFSGTRNEVLETRTPSAVAGLPRVPRLGTGGTLPGWVARDTADAAGLGIETVTYGADVADLDGDGHLDLFLSQHGGLPSLFLGDGTTFTRQDRDIYRRTDRHGCAIGSIAGSDLPDVVCVVGADGGTGLKANELWLDPGSGTTQNATIERGMADPLGRGRAVALFDADGDGDTDAFLGNQGMRYDVQASPNRLLRNDGTGHFTWDPASGLGSDRGAQCIHPVDLDNDGDLDLLVCGDNGSIVETSGLQVMRNVSGAFQDVTARLGVKRIGEVDAQIAQLGGGARPDLVQLSSQRIRISLWRDGGFRTVFERSLSKGRDLALGDIDGDGHLDIYVQTGDRMGNTPDVVLRNDGTGQHWTVLAVPSASAGRAESVIAFDADEDGRDEFLVLNGWLFPGPIQLIGLRPAP